MVLRIGACGLTSYLFLVTERSPEGLSDSLPDLFFGLFRLDRLLPVIPRLFFLRAVLALAHLGITYPCTSALGSSSLQMPWPSATYQG
jgi:hypothetical protein